MKRKFSLIAALSLMTICSSASACCMFPFFPPYSAGYPAFGFAPPVFAAPNYYAASYAPSYSYGGPSYSYGGCNSGCATNYSASYGSFSSGGCCNSCGCGSVGCADGNCVGSSCIGTEIRSRPEPDPQTERDLPSDRNPRTFGTEDDRTPDRNRRDERGYNDNLRSDDRNPLDPMGDDSFGASTPGSGAGDNSWSPRSRSSDPLLDDDLGGRDSGFDPLNDFNSNRKPPLDDGALAPSSDPMNDSVINRSSRKPPMSAPVHAEDATDQDEAGRNPSDLLPSADDVEPKSTSIKEATSFVRLAGYSATSRSTSASQVSSSQKKQRAPRWISLPAPAGRIRL